MSWAYLLSCPCRRGCRTGRFLDFRGYCSRADVGQMSFLSNFCPLSLLFSFGSYTMAVSDLPLLRGRPCATTLCATCVYYEELWDTMTSLSCILRRCIGRTSLLGIVYNNLHIIHLCLWLGLRGLPLPPPLSRKASKMPSWKLWYDSLSRGEISHKRIPPQAASSHHSRKESHDQIASKRSSRKPTITITINIHIDKYK